MEIRTPKQDTELNLRNTSSAWGPVSKLFHWATAFLIILAIILGWTAELMEMSPLKLNLFVIHKSIGITVLVLVALRLLWKLANPVPAPTSGISPLNARLANLGHWGLYVLMFGMPISGWILNSAANFPFKWFGIMPVPHLTAPNEILQNQAAIVHLTLSWILLAMLVGHIGMALVHHIRHKSEVLIRMLPRNPGLAVVYSELAVLGIILALAGAATLAAKPGQQQLPMAATAVTAADDDEQLVTAVAPEWEVITAQSMLGFTASYSGVNFDGRFENFTAIIHFDPDNPGASHFNVTVDITSVNTDSADRDAMLEEKDWFDFGNYPVSTFVTRSIRRTQPGKYVAAGMLDLKGRQNEIELNVIWLPDETQDTPARARMLVEGRIKRGDFGIGAGMWEKDETIGFTVLIKSELQLAARQAENPDPEGVIPSPQ